MNNYNLLVISNNVLSRNHNNGKTIFSFIDSLNRDKVYQLYFSHETPTIKGFRYFQISDLDVLKRRFKYLRRFGYTRNKKSIEYIKKRKIIKKTIFLQWFRELLWWHGWLSTQLLMWLDACRPAAIFFVAGDSIFAYSICSFIVNRYKAKLTIYITDDYILPRLNENFLEKIKRKYIIKKLKSLLILSNNFYTVSEKMKDEYKKFLGYNSIVISNLSESLKDINYKSDNRDFILVYTGNLYYGRAEVLGKIVEAIKNYNNISNYKKAFLQIYSNSLLDKKTTHILNVEGCSKFCGFLASKHELIGALNRANFLIFVESFDLLYVEKVKLSLSTKIPEYLSLGKPIITIGNSNVSSIQYLNDVSLCIFNPYDIYKKLFFIFNNPSVAKELGIKAEKKYNECHDKRRLADQFIKNLF